MASRMNPGFGRTVALLLVYLLWGSTYAANEIMLETIPPLLGTSSRFLIAGVVLCAFLLPGQGWRRFRMPLTWLGSAAVAGLFTLAAARGLVTYGQQFASSGLAALIVATVPLWIVLYRALGGDRARPVVLLGVVVGFVGIALLCLPSGLDIAEFSAVGIAALLVAALCEAGGTFGTARLAMPSDPLVTVTIQMSTAGTALLVLSFVTGELHTDVVSEASAASLLAVLYLAVPGGVVPFACLVWLLRTAPMSIASTYAYVNPAIALLLGWLLLGERLPPVALAGGALVLVAVVTVIRYDSRTAGNPDDQEHHAGRATP